MSTESKGAEFYVGLFLILGFAVIAVMAVKFGRIGQGFTKYYSIVVEFPNASGLVKNATVLLNGAPIGFVEEAPSLLVKETFKVRVKLNVQENIKIPRDSVIMVNQSGLLGDTFVDVLPPEKIDPTNIIQPGEYIVGRNKPGLDVLQAQGATVLEKLADEIDALKVATQSVNELLGPESRTALKETFENLRTTTGNLSLSSRKLDGVFDKADSAVESAKKTLETVDKAATDLRGAMTDFRKVADSANQTLDSAKGMVDTGNRVLKKAEQGEGALGVLLGDRETAENLRAFAANLRRSGPVFYKDREATPAKPESQPRPPRRGAPVGR
jgi:phospholipid/cholesterol/gamma-HCH transport system substrate-binding protein